jgi:hypothetical protein
MPELGPSGSARGAVSNHRPYRDPEIRRTKQRQKDNSGRFKKEMTASQRWQLRVTTLPACIADARRLNP